MTYLIRFALLIMYAVITIFLKNYQNYINIKFNFLCHILSHIIISCMSYHIFLMKLIV